MLYPHYKHTGNYRETVGELQETTQKKKIDMHSKENDPDKDLITLNLRKI